MSILQRSSDRACRWCMKQIGTHRDSSEASVTQVSHYGFTDLWCSIEVLKLVKSQVGIILSELFLGFVQCKRQSPYPVIGEADVSMSTSVVGPIGTLRVLAKLLQVAIVLSQKIIRRSLQHNQMNKM